MSDSNSMPTPAWMLTFADLLSLMLTFFVLIFAFASPNLNGKQFDKDGINFASVNQTSANHNIKLEQKTDGLATNYVYKVIMQKVAKDAELANLKFGAAEGALVIYLTKDEAIKLAPKLADILKVLNNDIEVFANNLGLLQEVNLAVFPSTLKENISFITKPLPDGQIEIHLL
jgi:flagellar motor protein MotB